MKPALLLTALLAVWITLGDPVRADDQTLEERLREASRAEYSGQQLVVSWTSLGQAAHLYRVQQADGTLLVEHQGEEAMMAAGEVVRHSSGGGWQKMKMASPSAPQLERRYRVLVQDGQSHMGRSVEPVEVWEDDLLRARYMFDRQTSVPLVTTVFHDDASAFRISSFASFSTRAPSLVTPPASGAQVIDPARSATLPPRAAGYGLTGSYEGPHQGVHAYYSDGLFTFSVFEIPGRIALEDLPDASEARMAGGAYRVRLMPSEMWVLWSGPDHSYLLVGDLPPGHLEEVLAELPAPHPEGLLSRLRRILLGS